MSGDLWTWGPGAGKLLLAILGPIKVGMYDMILPSDPRANDPRTRASCQYSYRPHRRWLEIR